MADTQTSKQSSIRAAHLKPFHFKAGQSGNPGGLPKKFRTFIRETTDDGRDLVKIMRTIADGKMYKKHRPTLHDIMDAVKWLAENGFGKAAQPVTGVDGDGPAEFVLHLKGMSNEKLTQLDSLLGEAGFPTPTRN